MALRPPLRVFLGSIVCYLLLWVDWLPTPLISPETRQLLVPVVRAL